MWIIKQKKLFADKNWQRILVEISHGIVDQKQIAQAISLCNEIDLDIIRHEKHHLLGVNNEKMDIMLR